MSSNTFNDDKRKSGIESVEEFVRLCDSDDPYVNRLAALGEAGESVWREIIERHPGAKQSVIFNKTVPLSILGLLAEDPDPWIRGFVAGKRKLSRELFERLARDPSPGVRQSIAGNPKIPKDLLDELGIDLDPGVREQAHEEIASRKTKERP